MNVRRVRIALWSVIAVLMIFLAFTYYSARKGNEIEPVKLGVPFSLIDQNGAPITEAAFQGHPTVLFFGFTHCPEVCPTTLFEMAGWLKALGPGCPPEEHHRLQGNHRCGPEEAAASHWFLKFFLQNRMRPLSGLILFGPCLS